MGRRLVPVIFHGAVWAWAVSHGFPLLVVVYILKIKENTLVS
jgi:hypothetical protein